MIIQIKKNKKKYIDLLLLADEQESMIDKYLERGEMFAIFDDDLKAICVVTDEGKGICELKNIATYPKYQCKGYGKQLIEYISKYYSHKYSTMLVGTGDSPWILSFYNKCGFIESHRNKNFFIDNYDHLMFDNGIQLVDMIYLSKNLCVGEDMDKQISIREFMNDDLEIFKKWLYTPHVAKWYEHPLAWIDEAEKRNDEFNWIHHFIVECENRPIGFCQYYEYYKSEEDWHGDIEIDGAYSIDYMIGDIDYIKKGLSKKLISALIDNIKVQENAKLIIVQPDPENRASCGALLASGFIYDEKNKLYKLEL